MRLHRFIGEFNLSHKKLKIVDSDIVNQIRKVLRLGKDDRITLCDGKGYEALALIKDFKKDIVEVDVLRVSENANEPKIHVVLYCSILKRSNFELVVQKATEVGVKEIVPLLCKRTVKLKVKTQRLMKIVREACEQSGRGVLPKLHVVMKFEEAVKHTVNNDCNFFFDISGEFFKPNSQAAKQLNKVGIFIGPEGGWAEEEITVARKEKFQIINLGKLTLRSETAAIVASYLVTSGSPPYTVPAFALR